VVTDPVSPEKCGYSVENCCRYGKALISAVFGPKSLVLRVGDLKFTRLGIERGKIIHDTRTTYPAMSIQSAILDPEAVEKQLRSALERLSSGAL